MYKFFCLKIELKKTKADSYMPCEEMAHSTKWDSQYHSRHVVSISIGNAIMIFIHL
jgi:hypothetical protein